MKQSEPIRRELVGVPPRPVLWTLDQIATMIAMELSVLKLRYIFYDGRSSGTRPRKMMVARNISPDDVADWRVAEQELFRWLRINGFRIHERGWLRA